MLPIRYVQPLQGKSSSHLITFDDGYDYAVKFVKSDYFRALPNEWLAYCLSRFMQLPVPKAYITEIPYSFYHRNPELQTVPYSTYQFASRYIPRCLEGFPSDFQLVNSEQSLAGMIVLDYWLCNQDRTRKNVLLEEVDQGKFKLWMIDQAEILGSHSWTANSLAQLPVAVMDSATHRMLATFITDENLFYEQCEIIQSIPSLLIEEILSVIPASWPLMAIEKQLILSELMTRREKYLPQLIHQFVKKVYRPLHGQN